MGYEISTSQMQHDAVDKKHNKIQASFSLEGTVLENVESIKDLGVTNTNDLKWNSHIRNVCTKANRTLGFLRRNLFSCPQDVKEAVIQRILHPCNDWYILIFVTKCVVSKQLIKVWCDQSLSMEAPQFGILIVMA